MNGTLCNPEALPFIEHMITKMLENKPSTTPCTISDYRSTMNTVVNHLEKIGLPIDPTKITPSHYHKFVSNLLAMGMSYQTIKGYTHILRKYCRSHGNYKLEEIEIDLPSDDRRNVDWLTDQQAYELTHNDWMSVEQKTLVHLELVMGLRRIDSIRLEMGYVDMDRMNLHVRGKGKGNGKHRDVDFVDDPDDPCMDTKTVLSEYLEYRQSLIDLARRENPKVDVPDRLLIYKKFSKLGAFSENGTAIDNRIREISEKSGIKLSNHTLRRTFGRNLHDAGVPLPEISVIMGHSNSKITEKYLGLDRVSHKNAMSRKRYAKR